MNKSEACTRTARVRRASVSLMTGASWVCRKSRSASEASSSSTELVMTAWELNSVFFTISRSVSSTPVP